MNDLEKARRFVDNISKKSKVTSIKKSSILLICISLISLAVGYVALNLPSGISYQYDDLTSSLGMDTLDIQPNLEDNESLEDNSTHVLEITGPVDAFEGEEVGFTVTLDGAPIQARVTFGGLLPANYTNISTGIVRFTMPSGGKEYMINACVPGGLKASHFILVKKL